MIEIKHVSKTYNGEKKALKDVSFKVNDGKIFAFIGHNGAGKSTTIKSVVGILPFEEGDIYIGGLSIKDHPVECKKMIGYIPDNPDLYDSLTGIGYLNFIGDLFDVSTEKRKEIIEKYATMFELHNDLNNFISSYSHGMKQKLALISAFIHEPKLLVLDEPFVGLDPKATFLVKKVMKKFCENGGSIFFSTHILEVAQKLCNKIAIIKKGKLVTYGDMETVTKEASLEEVFMELVDNA